MGGSVPRRGVRTEGGRQGPSGNCGLRGGCAGGEGRGEGREGRGEGREGPAGNCGLSEGGRAEGKV